MFWGMMAVTGGATGFMYAVEMVMFVSAVVMNEGCMTHIEVSVIGIRHTTGDGNGLDCCRVTVFGSVVVCVERDIRNTGSCLHISFSLLARAFVFDWNGFTASKLEFKENLKLEGRRRSCCRVEDEQWPPDELAMSNGDGCSSFAVCRKGDGWSSLLPPTTNGEGCST